ncbi:hypothetical protein Q3F67_13400, partial [Enterococcus faecium]|nr:hypothetical protein [Enterococcus faecium]
MIADTGNKCLNFFSELLYWICKKKEGEDHICRIGWILQVDLSQYLGHILVETVKPFFLLLILQI